MSIKVGVFKKVLTVYQNVNQFGGFFRQKMIRKQMSKKNEKLGTLSRAIFQTLLLRQ